MLDLKDTAMSLSRLLWSTGALLLASLALAILAACSGGQVENASEGTDGAAVTAVVYKSPT